MRKGGRKGKAGGDRKPERGKELGNGKGGDKSPAWSSPDLGSTAKIEDQRLVETLMVHHHLPKIS